MRKYKNIIFNLTTSTDPQGLVFDDRGLLLEYGVLLIEVGVVGTPH